MPEIFNLKEPPVTGDLCTPLRLHYPAIYHHKQTLTRDEAAKLADQYDLPQSHGPSTCSYYSFNPKSNFLGNTGITTSIISALHPKSAISLCIRYHQNTHDALNYLEAHYDISPNSEDDDYHVEPITVTTEGVFTLLEIVTKNHWNGPCILHVACHPTPTRLGRDYWTQLTRSDGSKEFCR